MFTAYYGTTIRLYNCTRGSTTIGFYRRRPKKKNQKIQPFCKDQETINIYVYVNYQWSSFIFTAGYNFSPSTSCRIVENLEKKKQLLSAYNRKLKTRINRKLKPANVYCILCTDKFVAKQSRRLIHEIAARSENVVPIILEEHSSNDVFDAYEFGLFFFN